jgi:predicted MFS family arabinose efflux permease
MRALSHPRLDHHLEKQSTNSQALLALALASFGIGTTEFVIMGRLPDVAHDLRVTIPRARLLVSVYALGVVVCADPRSCHRTPR